MEMEGWGMGMGPLKIVFPQQYFKKISYSRGVGGAPPNMHQQIKKRIKDEKTVR